MTNDPNANAVATTERQETLPAMHQPKAQLVAGNRVQAIVPQTIEEAYRLAGAITAADMAPKSYKRDANAVMIGIMHGMEVGFTPMAALQSIAVINGMPSIWGDGALALIEASGLLEDKKEWLDDETQTYHCHMKRRGRPTWIEQKFSWEDAKTAKLIGKDTYQQYGRRMLQRRARAWCMTDGFSDVLRGLHIREAMVLDSNGEEDQTAPPQRPTRASVAQTLQADTVVDDAAERQAQELRDAEARANGRIPEEPEIDAGEVEPEVDESEPTDAEMPNRNASDIANQPASAQSHNFPAIRKTIEGKLLKAGKADAIDALANEFAAELGAMKLQQPDMARELSAAFAARRKKLEG